MIPKNAKLKKNNHVAEGEATGHYHGIKGGQVLELDNRIFIKAKQETILEHQEHNQIQIPMGDKEVFKVQEYDHLEEEAREVID